MKIDTNTPVAALCEGLREISVGNCLLSDDNLFLVEAADRLELLDADNEDLRSDRRQWKMVAESRWEEICELKERINRLKQAGDEITKWADRNTPVTVRNDWTEAKDAKP